MAYSGYRIKIGNTIFPNNNIAKGSFSIERNPRPCKTWVDLTGVSHETYYPTSRTTIKFSVREHEASDHSTLASFFSNRSVTVQYWDDNTSAYVTGSFHIEDFEWSHDTVKSNGAFYGKTQITLKEW